MTTLTFPIQPTSSIVSFVKQHILMGCEAKSLGKNDLVPNPKPEVIQKIYMRVLQLVFDYRPEQFYVVPMGLDLPYTEIYEGFAALGTLSTLMEQFMPYCRVSDFCLSDVLDPKAKRTLYLLSGIVNYIHFRQYRQKDYMEHLSKYKASLESMHQLQKLNDEAQMKIEKLSTVPPEQQAEFKVISTGVQELQQTINQEYQAKVVTLQERIAQNKAISAEKNKKLSQIRLDLATMKEDQERMKSQIIESPERRKNKMEKLRENVMKLKREQEEINERYENYQDKIAFGIHWQLEVQSFCKKQQSKEAILEKTKLILAEIRNEEEQIANDNNELKSLASEELLSKRNVNQRKEKIIKLDTMLKKKREDNEQRSQEVNKVYNCIQEKRGTVVEQMDQVQKKIKKVQLERKHLLESMEKEKMKSQEIIRNLKAGLDKYHESLMKVRERNALQRREKIAELTRLMNRRKKTIE
ncbi:kinetochore protein Nuf2 [Microcaecilia unicolor]|uniref:Kinetochore protein Nuf2 n=1 Tax=Microcaecilia unicolor TaxID=1415580 RepID=A0A6P7YE92_9AMPH|nr:kinetochore protein Nuf2 [Microcaecilia unicolor]